MIVRDGSERGILLPVAHQPPSTQADMPVSCGRMVHIPGWVTLLYAGLFTALGWFGGEQRRHPSSPQTLSLPVAYATLLPLTAVGKTVPKNLPSAVKPSTPAAPVVDGDMLPPLCYSAHVYASLLEERSIALGGKAWSEGDSPLPNLVVEQIQQDVTTFSLNGTAFTLAASDDRSGEKIDEEPKGE